MDAQSSNSYTCARGTNELWFPLLWASCVTHRECILRFLWQHCWVLMIWVLPVQASWLPIITPRSPWSQWLPNIIPQLAKTIRMGYIIGRIGGQLLIGRKVKSSNPRQAKIFPSIPLLYVLYASQFVPIFQLSGPILDQTSIVTMSIILNLGSTLGP